MTIAPFLIIAIGACLRLYHLVIVGFSGPWVLGGLYMEFSRQIFLNHYALPAMIPNYSLGGLPFAYPPLPFYIEAFLVFTLGLPKFLVANALPPLISVLSLIAFYRLSRKMITSPYARLFALALYALLPLSFIEQVETAGLAESFGALFIILFLGAFLDFYKDPNNKNYLILAAVFWALCVMASPASAYVSIPIFISFFLILLKKEKGRIKSLIPKILLLGGIAVLLSAPYWGMVIRHHGTGVFVESFLGQHGVYVSFLINALLVIYKFIYNPIAVLFPLLFVFTLCVLIYFRKYGFLLLLVLAGLIPRELWIMGIIGVIFAGFALDLIIQKRQGRELPAKKKWLPFAIVLPLVILLIAVETTLFCLNREIITPDNTLSAEQIDLLENIDTLDPTRADLIVIGGDNFLEWAPYLAERTVLNVWYGTEFAPDKVWLEEYTNALKECGDLQCVNQLIADHFSQNTLVLIDSTALPDLHLANAALDEYQDSGIYYYWRD
jgi:hypothetical protein